ncbi:uncharacterized protein LOC131003633 [Salvia miltiorrhiza]|uniref:uncharacterized protein LOC131003633 n=1 Tax=Salvia miltiorrhiza TaxID=226208 RepID=UPI0025AC1168|nr:uncharacterized protein LOC131003633 [Salvia miltiorrhiza]
MAEKAARAFGGDLGNAKFNFPNNPPKIEIQVADARFAHASTGAETSVDDLDSQSNSLSSSEALQHAESPCPSVSERLQTTAGVRCCSPEVKGGRVEGENRGHNLGPRVSGGAAA